MTSTAKAAPKAVPLDQVDIAGGLWQDRQLVNREKTIPAIYDQLQKTGRLDAWRMDPNRERPKKRTVITMFFDSDTAKWLEAVGYSLQTHPDSALEKQTDDLIDWIEKAQQADGYLNTYFGNLEPENKWRNVRDYHEMYNAGHLIEGAVAYHQATGKRPILDTLTRFADHIEANFGPREGQKRGYPGHPELELALVKLYRDGGDEKYLKLAQYFVNERGQQPHYFDLESIAREEDPTDFWAQTYKYCQAHKPVREQTEATGHSVRACYLYAGIADVALETGDAELVAVSRRLWNDLTSHQLYITGGLGPAHSNEGFTFAYDLPNETAYAETCAAIALAFWAQRMFHLDPHGRYIDVMERALYNNVLSGVSYEGDHFFYANPLTSYPYVNPFEHFSGITSNKHYRREEWFFCPCCPPNVARIVASIGSYFYSTTADRVYVHLYNQNTASLNLGGTTVTLAQQTHYPWEDTIRLTVGVAQPTAFELALRIPGWCHNYTLAVNDTQVSIIPETGYVVIARQWTDGDSVTLTLAMPVERMVPHPDIRHDAGQIALQRGPIVYCLEEVDNGARLANVALPQDAALETRFDASLFGGVSVIHAEGVRIESMAWTGDIYLPHSAVNYQRSPAPITAIPYFLWANRAPGEMRVWIREA